jgi:hypothetical protein
MWDASALSTPGETTATGIGDVVAWSLAFGFEHPTNMPVGSSSAIMANPANAAPKQDFIIMVIIL